jgi:uncharacterized repeat protein (TIGR03803 family)
MQHLRSEQRDNPFRTVPIERRQGEARSPKTIAIFLAVALLFGVSRAVKAQNYTLNTLVNFDQTSNGALPYAGVTRDAEGNLYGTTAGFGGSSNGTVWKYSPLGTGAGTGGLGSGTLTTLVQFNNTNGSTPYGGVTLDNITGNLYGTTYEGGTYGDGTIWKYNTIASTLTTLADFGTDENSAPYTGITLDGSGGLYGTSEATLYHYLPSGTGLGTGGLSTGTLTILSTMNNGPAPVESLAPVTLDSNGNLYGTSQGGGAFGLGTVWEYSTANNTLMTLASFNGSNGSLPFNSGVTMDGSGNLYGTTAEGGTFDNGVLWEYNTSSNTLTDLVNFNDLAPTLGAFPYAGVTFDGHDTLYGTTEAGGLFNEGTVWKYDLLSQQYFTIENFNLTDGGNLYGSVTLDSSGNLYGTTYNGGAFGDGTVFELTTTAPEPGSLALLGMIALPVIGMLCRRSRKYLGKV